MNADAWMDGEVRTAVSGSSPPCSARVSTADPRACAIEDRMGKQPVTVGSRVSRAVSSSTAFF